MGRSSAKKEEPPSRLAFSWLFHLLIMPALHMTRVAVGCADYRRYKRGSPTMRRRRNPFHDAVQAKRADERSAASCISSSSTSSSRASRFCASTIAATGIDIVCVAVLERIHPQPNARIKDGVIWR